MTLLPALLALAALASPASARRVVGRVAATVNGEVVTLLDVIERAGNAYASARERAAGAARDRAPAEITACQIQFFESGQGADKEKNPG